MSISPFSQASDEKSAQRSRGGSTPYVQQHSLSVLDRDEAYTPEFIYTPTFTLH